MGQMEKKRELIAAIDAGTTGTRCCIFNKSGEIVSSGYYPMETFYPNSGRVEQDPNTIINLTVRAVKDAVEAIDPYQIIGLCITVQRNSFVPIASDESFLTNVITWQDQRGEMAHSWMMDCLKKSGLTLEDFYRINGQPFASFQYGFKALWLRKFREDIYDKTYKFVTPQAVLSHFFGAEGYREECNNQSFWLMADADKQKIDADLCGVFDFDPSKFPEAVEPGTCIGTVSAKAAQLSGLIEGTPIYLGSGDQNCGALGAGNYGTSDIMSICMGTAGLCIAYSEKTIRHPKGMCQVQGHPAGGYLIETHSSSCMSSYRWAENCFYPDSDERKRFQMTKDAACAPIGSNGVIFIPYLQGAACPHYDDTARGAYIGLSLANQKSDMSRATMEGICFENRMMLETLKEADLPNAKNVRVIGGASNNDFWNQMQTDIYGLPVETITAKEATALGAAIICSVASGIYKDYKEASDNMTHILKRYEPNKEHVSQYNEVYDIWNDCYLDLSQRSFKKIFHYQTRE